MSDKVKNILSILLAVLMSLGILIMTFELGNSIYNVYLSNGIFAVIISFIIGISVFIGIFKLFNKFCVK